MGRQPASALGVLAAAGVLACAVVLAAVCGAFIAACDSSTAAGAGAAAAGTTTPAIAPVVTTAPVTTGDPAGTTSVSTTPTVAQSTTTAPVSESALLPKVLPPDAVAVDVPILMYHYVDETPPPAGPYADDLTVRTGDFEAEMEYLFTNGYSTVSFADVYLAMAGLRELPDRPVVLTFDDGGVDNYEVAFPILKAFGFTATFFIITGTTDRGAEGVMRWDQLREMAAKGMSIQSHTVSHPDLRGSSAAKLEAELVDSRQAIAEAIGGPSYVLCYPAGAYDDDVIEAVRTADMSWP